jgi:hypothetical protein
MTSRRSTRIKAAELASLCLGHQLAATGDAAGRLFALVIFFELYIDHGASHTENSMHLLSARKTKKLRLIAGGNLK